MLDSACCVILLGCIETFTFFCNQVAGSFLMQGYFFYPTAGFSALRQRNKGLYIFYFIYKVFTVL